MIVFCFIKACKDGPKVYVCGVCAALVRNKFVLLNHTLKIDTQNLGIINRMEIKIVVSFDAKMSNRYGLNGIFCFFLLFLSIISVKYTNCFVVIVVLIAKLSFNSFFPFIPLF